MVSKGTTICAPEIEEEVPRHDSVAFTKASIIRDRDSACMSDVWSKSCVSDDESEVSKSSGARMVFLYATSPSILATSKLEPLEKWMLAVLFDESQPDLLLKRKNRDLTHSLGIDSSLHRGPRRVHGG